MPPVAVPGLLLSGLTLRYRGQAIFEDLALSVPPGRFVALLGPSGVGKSSLLKIAAGLIRPQSGVVAADDGLPLRGRVAYMAQQDLLYPWLTVAQNVMLGDRLRGTPRDPGRAAGLLAAVGLHDRGDALPAQLSGGMRQRAALARTLYEDRPIVLMDEPFSALDSPTRARIQTLAAGLLHGRTVLLITHDPLEACRIGDELRVLSGSPARLGAPIAVPGPAPRPPDDPDLLRVQGQLLRALMEAVPE